MVSLSLDLARSGFHRVSPLSRITFLIAIAVYGAVAAQAQGLTSAEKQATAQIAQGKSADFSQASVGGAFIVKLLSGGFKAQDPSHNMDVHGITISNAAFDDEIDINFEVPYRVVFDHCQFRQGLDLTGSQFDRDLVFDKGTTFGTKASYPPADPDNPPAVRFINATVNGTISLDNGDFYLPLDFTKAHVKELDINNANFESADQDDAELDLSAVSVDTDLTLTVQAAEPRQVSAHLLSVGRLANFGTAGKAFFATDQFSLDDTHFNKLMVYEMEQWQPKLANGALDLNGLSLQEIRFSCSPTACGAGLMLQLLDSPQASYSPQPYLALEQYLSTIGDQVEADKFYVRMRQRQGGKMNWPGRLADWVLDWVLGYGREPHRALWWSLGFVVVGMLVFTPRRMVPQESVESSGNHSRPPAYNRFWYSLDVLAPAIELGADSAWKPDPDWRLGRNYSYLHRIVGWILVPLILAALTGVIH